MTEEEKQAEERTAAILRELAKMVEAGLQAASGERLGFSLIVYPLTEKGMVSYISNCPRTESAVALEVLLERWRESVNVDYSDTTH